MNVLLGLSKLLTIIGGINWGLIGFFDFNLVDTIFGAGSVGAKVVYIVVGIAALLTLLDFVPREGRGRTEV